MANNTSCRAGKTIVVDPNAFDGQSSSSNIFVPLEDLSISVQLETKKKPRTVLTTSAEGVENKSRTSKGVSVTFIEGSKTNGNGEKVLTTKYTDLTTSFDDSNESENLGITNIEIDFTSSYAPLISITFVDLRGSAVFQNEANIANGKNKYATFFQLPYPTYDLTVKGYYGLPVKYTLHMTKFNAKFNSQTGNFEIVANFVGYTYAMLSDMLLGYLRAIPHTKLGKTVYDQLRDPALGGNPSLLTLDELMTKISQIDSASKKMQADDDDFTQLNAGNTKEEALNLIKTNIYNLGQATAIPNDAVDEYQFIVLRKDENGAEATAISDYTELVSKSIIDYNLNNGIQLNVADFTGKALTDKKYIGLTIRLLKITPDSDATFQATKEERISNKLNNPPVEDLNKTRTDLIRYAKEYGLGPDVEFNVYDLRLLYEKISIANKDIELEIKQLKKKLGEKFRIKIKDTLGLDPTVRNIINVFTASVEAFMTVIYQVSISAIGENRVPRANQLKKFSPEATGNQNSYDIPAKSNAKSSTESGPLTDLYYPWPDYRVDDDKTGLVETYLGDPDVLDNPEDVDELRFIDDLLKAFLESAAQAAADEVALIEDQSNWVPSNPLDTRLFIDTYPYKRNPLNSKSDVINAMLIRLFTYVGLSNRGITSNELINFAKIESASVLQDAVNPSVLKSLAALTKNDFINAIGVNDGENFNIFRKKTDTDGSIYYYYNYMFGAATDNELALKYDDTHVISGKYLLPIGPDPLDNKVVFYESKEAAENGKLFLTNYNTTLYEYSTPDDGAFVKKPDDGGIYLKILKKEEYDGTKALPIPGVASNGNVLNLDTFKKKQTEFTAERDSAGFDQFGGKYGIQEYRDLNFGADFVGLEKAPYMAMFYDNSCPAKEAYNISNGLGLKRKSTQKTDYDISANTLVYKIMEDQALTSNAFDYAIENIYDTPLHDSYGKNRELATLSIRTGSSDIVYPYINFWVEDSAVDDGGTDLDVVPISLFGSRFYYGQDNDYAKALLFLHTFPWNGLILPGGVFANNPAIFSRNEIINTFSNRAGFVFAPKLWSAFIGGLLWRADYSNPIYIDGTTIQYSGGSGTNDPVKWLSTSGDALIPSYTTGILGTNVPTKLEYLTSVTDGDFPDGPMNFSSRVAGTNYKKIEQLLLQLPDQVKQEFKESFFKFVATNDAVESDWSRVKKALQVFNGTGAQWDTAWDFLISSNGIERRYTNDSVAYKNQLTAQYNATTNSKLVFDNYIVFTPYMMWTHVPIPIEDNKYDYNYFMELRDDCDANRLLVKLFTEEVVIANMSTKIWDVDAMAVTTQLEGRPVIHEKIAVKESDMTTYIDTVIASLKPADGSSVSDIEKQRKSEIFGTENDNLIKFQLYRTCKNIYDKWVGGTETIDKLIFDGPRNGLDAFLAKKARGDNAQPTLIDSFRFVTRSFRDIGDEMVINPKPVYDFLHDNPNASFYDSVTSLLSANNFDFIALPNYINYGDEHALKSMFKPMTSADAFNVGTTGPSFVCVYVGQTSKHLDFRDSEYTNDGIDFTCDSKGGLMPTNAKDFTSTNGEDYENKVAVFAVNYSQQNQNIFKDITLDQSEFTETAESLQITDEIANKGDKNSRTFGGQNIFNVYSVRSYKTEVDMMGNAMIQPMMYFQLNNIPMFHGAYMITHVKHSIKPNTMSTHFTGVRIRNVETPLMDVSELFMSLLDSVEANNTKDPKQSFGNSLSGAYPPIVLTIIDNGGLNGNMQPQMSKIGDLPAGITNSISDTKELLAEAIAPLKAMLTEWVTWMKAEGFVGSKGTYANINSAFRTHQQQVDIRTKHGSNAARPGTSNHGWGIAIDFQFYKKNGDIIFNYDKNGKPNVNEGYNFDINESIVWLLKNSYRFGWVIPENLRDNAGLEEFWHFEYHGKAAACILAKRNTIKKLTGIDTTKPYEASVTNPKNAKDADYVNCDYKVIKGMDGTTDGLAVANPNILVTHPSADDVASYTKILTNVGAKATPENLKFMYAWRAAEGGKAAWNPFNTTKNADGTTNYNENGGHPVKNYPSKEVGIKATSDTLNASYYKKIVSGLQNDIGADKLSTIIDELKTWGTGAGIARVLHGSTVNPPAIPTTTTKTV
jgi:LAS superfamily LD-carboxypeptidase LdcB